MSKIYTSPWGQLEKVDGGNAISQFEKSPRLQDLDKTSTIHALTGQVFTHKQIRVAYSKFATVLSEKYDIKKGDTVCLYGHNTPLMQAVHFSIISLGAVVSPVNVMYTADELAHQLSMVEAKMIYASEDVIDDAVEGAAIVAEKGLKVNVKSYEEILAEMEAAIEDPNIKPTSPVHVDGVSHPAYYCFSSGTSGLPKGVEITHNNIFSNCLQMCAPFRDKDAEAEAEIHGAFLPMSHIMGLNAFVWTVPYNGASQVVLPRFDFLVMLDSLIKYKVSRVALVPPMMNGIARHPIMEQYLPKLKGIVKSFKIGAAPTAASTVEAAQARFPGTEFTQGYGMTETSPVTLIAGWNENKDYNFASSGWLVPGCEARIIDVSTGKDAAEGERGEFWVRGPNIMKGYLKNPEATAATMAPGGWLKTGDVVKRDETGQFYIVDRIKELIKSMGHQVAPAELEGILLTNSLVADVAVIGINDAEAGTEKPRAFIVLQPDVDESRALEIVKWFNKKVSKPKRLWGGAVVISAIPKSPSGKIIRRELQERVTSGIDEPFGFELAKL